ncbi:MAG: C-type lectin domain-containing protein [Myxococcota bacterium]|nr:C-type lectin domain-containing protein [Deltaproteobacteria bacterium]MDQ3341805.1 C-type lectin domain-containing protein [Myxococcota bacterium]
MLMLLVTLASAGCLRSTTFQCEENTECGTGGMCEADGLCSVASSGCTSGREYGPNSGGKSGDCVGGSGGEAGMEMPGEAGGEPAPMGCRADYVALANSGPRAHRYLLVNVTGTWSVQRDFCVANMGFLAFPDGTNLANAQLEHDALRTLAADGAWVGVNDIVTEGQYRTSLNMPASASTQALMNLGGNPNPADCMFINTTTLNHTNCGDDRKAVCECVP